MILMMAAAIKIKVNGNGTLNIGNTDRIKLGTENEVNRVKILIIGQTNDEFKDEYVRK